MVNVSDRNLLDLKYKIKDISFRIQIYKHNEGDAVNYYASIVRNNLK